MENTTGKGKNSIRFEDAATLVIGLVLAVFHIYTSFFGALPSYQHRIVHLVMSMMLVPLGAKLFHFKNQKVKLVLQIAIIAILAVVGIYSYSIANDMWKSSGTISNTDLVLGTIFIIMLLVFTWRVVGAAMPIIAILCILYALLGPKLPSGIAHRGYNWSRITELLFKGTNGIFGTPLGVSSIYVSVFVIFAGVLEASGAGDVFIRLTQSLLGGFRGGPAKVAVVASSLFGTISGSAVANVVGTGAFTIPLMKKSGFKPEFAGAVETAASSGGQLMPPVMGAAAFIMADYIGSYQDVLIAAIIPAILFYIALFMMIDLEALTKVSRQLDVSMGNMMGLVNGFAVMIYMIVIYLLSKIIIEKNAQSISMTKILGYTNGEISRLYIMSTMLVVIIELLISLPIEKAVMNVIFRAMMMSSMTGWITLWIDPKIYVEMFLVGFITYVAVAFLEYRKIRKVPMDEALKNVE